MKIFLLITLLLSFSFCLITFSCEKQKPPEWIVRALTREEEKAREDKARQERVAIVREVMTKQGILQYQITDEKADEIYRKVIKDVAKEECKLQ